MDSVEFVKQLDDNSVDMIVTDPPYNISQKKKIDRTHINNRALHREGKKSKVLDFDFGAWDFFETSDYLKWMEVQFVEWYRVAKDNCSVYMWCPKSEVSFLEYLLKKVGFRVRSTLVWCKKNPTPQIFKVGFMSGTEFCIFATKHEGRKHKWKVEHGQQLNYWVRGIVQGKERTIHPTQKPLDLTRHFIKLGSDEGDVIIDPFMGSGTTAVACKIMNRRYIGCDINPEYIKVAEERLVNSDDQKKYQLPEKAKQTKLII
jgi:DNA modification methylase